MANQWQTQKEEVDYYYGQLRRILESGPTYGCPPKLSEVGIVRQSNMEFFILRPYLPLHKFLVMADVLQ